MIWFIFLPGHSDCFGTGLWGGQSGGRRLLPPKQEMMLAQGWRQWKWGEVHRFQIHVEGNASRTN